MQCSLPSRVVRDRHVWREVDHRRVLDGKLDELIAARGDALIQRVAARQCERERETHRDLQMRAADERI